MLIPLAML